MFDEPPFIKVVFQNGPAHLKYSNIIRYLCNFRAGGSAYVHYQDHIFAIDTIVDKHLAQCVAMHWRVLHLRNKIYTISEFPELSTYF